jgi:hypothetical protein
LSVLLPKIWGYIIFPKSVLYVQIKTAEKKEEVITVLAPTLKYTAILIKEKCSPLKILGYTSPPIIATVCATIAT